MKVSVVINTYNRCASLRQTLLGLRYQTHRPFEVVVVNGPSTDDTEKVLAEFAGLRLGHCPEVHLSKSRNVGIGLASGEVVAFIDDDAIPDPHWLTDLVQGYDHERVGGVGGIVYGSTGFDLQFNSAATACDRLGNPHWNVPPPYWDFTLPSAERFLNLLGTNASFRRSCLEEIGGFDEEIEYYLDETEVCMRVIDRGYLLRQLSNAAVYHRFLPSHLRNQRKVLRRPFPIVKNKLYFALKASVPAMPVEAVVEECERFNDRLIQDAHVHHEFDALAAEDLAAFTEEVDRGRWLGIARGTHAERRSADIPPARPEAFHAFPTLTAEPHQYTFCFVSQEKPPEDCGGVGRFTWELARGFAARGHEVHFLTRSPDHNRIDFEEGVWIHRLLPETDGPWHTTDLTPVVKKNLGRAAAVHREVRRLRQSRVLDLVSVPLWDCEGLYCLLDSDLTCVLSLQTSLKIVTELSPSLLAPADRAAALALERFTLQSARHVHSISGSILEKIRGDYGCPDGDANVFVAPLGIADRAAEYAPRPADGRVRVLFVGRLEPRKGIDIFLDAARALAREFPHVEFVAVGNDAIPAESGLTYRAAFQNAHAGDSALDRIRFTGQVSEDELYRHYSECDVFCLPARYESFGLVFLEAMMFGKPVVGCDVGGMTEVVEHGGNGFLVEPGDVGALVEHLRRLIADEALRRACGSASRRRYEAEFSADRMVERALAAYTGIIDSRKAA